MSPLKGTEWNLVTRKGEEAKRGRGLSIIRKCVRRIRKLGVGGKEEGGYQDSLRSYLFDVLNLNVKG